MTITRERKSDYSRREAGGRGDPCPCKRSDEGIRDFYREYAGCSGINDLAGVEMPLPFCAIFDKMKLQLQVANRQKQVGSIYILPALK